MKIYITAHIVVNNVHFQYELILIKLCEIR